MNTTHVLIREGSIRAFDKVCGSREEANQAIVDFVRSGSDPDYWNEINMDLTSSIEFLQLHGYSVRITEDYPEEK